MLAKLGLALSLLVATTSAESGRNHLFSIKMLTDGSYQALFPVYNGSETTLVLKASQGIEGAAAYALKHEKYYGIYYERPTGLYGLQVPQVGDDYGNAFPVVAVLNGSSHKWIIGQGDNDGIGHVPQAALDGFYACTDQVDGVAGVFLKYGVPTSPDLHNPPGCNGTTVIQDFNV